MSIKIIKTTKEIIKTRIGFSILLFFLVSFFFPLAKSSTEVIPPLIIISLFLSQFDWQNRDFFVYN